MVPFIPPSRKENKPMVDDPTPTQSQLKKEIKFLESVGIDVMLLHVCYKQKKERTT